MILKHILQLGVAIFQRKCSYITITYGKVIIENQNVNTTKALAIFGLPDSDNGAGCLNIVVHTRYNLNWNLKTLYSL